MDVDRAVDGAVELIVEDLRVDVVGARRTVRAVDRVSLRVRAGTVHAVVGESGSGKSTLLRAASGALPAAARADGRVLIRRAGPGPGELGRGTAREPYDVDVLAASRRRRFTMLPPTSPLSGRVIGTVPQSAATALTPVRTLGAQLAETVRALGSDREPAELARSVGLDVADLDRFPHQLSGGMAQRAAFALAVAGDPPVLLADEPTSSLDPELTERVLAMLRAHADAGGTVLLVTHDLAELARSRVADEISVMHGGTVVESGSADAVLNHAEHEYTRRLLQALPGARPATRSPASVPDGGPRPLVAERLVYTVPDADGADRRTLFDGLDLRIEPGEVVGLTGPSGVGKSSLVRLLSGLVVPDAGRVLLGDVPVGDVRRRSGRAVRGRIGVVFQSPRAALDGRVRLDRSIAWAGARARHSGASDVDEDELARLGESIGLTPDLLARRPHEVSDGQLQRAALLRTVAQAPEVILCDEITAALDPLSSAAVMDAVERIVAVRGCGVLVVSHDRALVAERADRVVTLG